VEFVDGISVISGNGTISMETIATATAIIGPFITLILAFYGAVLSTYLIHLKRKEDKVDIRVTIRKIVDESPCHVGEAPMYTILAQNFGKRTVNITSVQLKLQCMGKEYPFKFLKNFDEDFEGDISIPYQFLPDRKIETTIYYWDICKSIHDKYKDYKEGDFYGEKFDLDPEKRSSCKLIACFEDQLENIYQSKPVEFRLHK
jgi:hypothetical protein